MQSHTQLALFLCCVWVATILYGEMFAYWLPLFTCSWPTLRSPSGGENQVKIAVLADPQIMDRTSLGLPPKSRALEAAQFYTDLYMRRAFHASILPFQPDIIVFLGDQFDGGPYLSDQDWDESLRRFKHIFALSRNSRNPSIYYLVGNHDIGYADHHTRHPEVISRYEKAFGTRNYKVSAGKVDFVVVDAQTLDGPEQGKETSMTWEFINNISKDSTMNLKVLLTHIPLYRPDWTPCGLHRSSPIINQRITNADADEAIVYQNYVSKKSSDKILDLIRPILVLSGHDHDQCTVSHLTPFGNVTEHTLGTISWQQGNLYPSFMLLSVRSSTSNETNAKEVLSTQLCFLPMQTHIYIWYLSQFFITIILLIIWPVNGFGLGDKCISYIRMMKSTFMATTKEKDDENYEYEEIWDAEGSMHLIKKPIKEAATAKTDTGMTGRGGVISRPTAKKILQEYEASISLDMSTESKLDNTKAARTSRSGLRKLIQRTIRVISMVMIIVTVNVPLYMMLLFKDWIHD